MTREEAIDIVKCLAWHTRPNEEDIEQAIEALSAEPCEDAISRADTIEWLKRVTVTDGITFETGFKQILADIQNMPPVTPKQKMGRWIKEKKHHKDDFQEFDYWDVRCSECGARKRIGWTNIRHCPMCGAKMAESEDAE